MVPTPFGVRHEALTALAAKLGVTETKAVDIAINRLYACLFGEDEDCDFPSDAMLARIDRSQEDHGKIVRSRSLADHFVCLDLPNARPESLPKARITARCLIGP